jgi:sugar (pentulose or hexulose) kinase
MVSFSTNRVAAPVFERLSLRPDLLPPICAPDEVIGHITQLAGAETGLAAGLPVICGWNDLNASVLGSGAILPGDAFNVTGTSEHIGVITTADCRVPELVCAPFLPGRKLLYGVTSCGGGSLEWYAGLAGRELSELVEAAVPVEPEAAPLFLPYLEGERSPIWDPRASGAFVGLKTAHETHHLARAVLQGVAFSLRQILEIVNATEPIADCPIILSGGAARLRLWNQIKADVWKRPVIAPRNSHAGVLGAAMLAAVGAGLYDSVEQAARVMARSGETFRPDPDEAGVYDSIYAVFADLYPALSGIMTRLHESRSQRRICHVA